MDPIYRKLQQKIKSQILSGVYHDGDLLPSESDLIKIHSSTRGTVRQALEALVKEGYILSSRVREALSKNHSAGHWGYCLLRDFHRL